MAQADDGDDDDENNDDDDGGDDSGPTIACRLILPALLWVLPFAAVVKFELLLLWLEMLELLFCKRRKIGNKIKSESNPAHKEALVRSRVSSLECGCRSFRLSLLMSLCNCYTLWHNIYRFNKQELRWVHCLTGTA